jgi:hypothetical protein
MRLLAALFMALGAIPSAQAEEYSKSYAVTGRPEVHVRVDDSSVRVITSDTPSVDFNVKREGTSGLMLGGGLKIESHQDGNRVELTVLHKPGIALGYSEKNLVTEVRMPRDGDLKVESRDGAVHAAQLNGRIELQSSDGSITADAIKGEARLHSSDGAITITHFDGKCDASSTDGSLRAEGRFDALDLASTDGSVVAKVAPGSKMTSAWNIKSADGSLEVLLPPGFQANIRASTTDGHINLALPVTVQGDISRSKVRGTLNGGGPELTLKSSDGSIRLGAI